MNILLTVLSLDRWQGSVIQVLEYAESLSKSNQVTVACFKIMQEVRSILKKNNVKVFIVSKESFPLHYDLVYSFHYPVFSYLLQKGVTAKKWIAGSFSPTTLLESFPSYWKEANYLTVQSGRSVELHNINYGIPQEKIELFENPLPDEFADFEHHKSGFPELPGKIVVVSNHIPHELLKIKKYLPKNIKIDFYGYKKKCVRIKPQILADYDLIITIGKTVQYGLGMGIPVYEYDVFGGCGYISPENYESEKFRNFCGLATERKLDSKTIAAEILQYYQNAVQNREVLRMHAIDDFLLSKLMKKFLDLVNAAPEINLSREKLSDYSLQIAHDIETANLLVEIDEKLINRIIFFVRKLIHNRK